MFKAFRNLRCTLHEDKTTIIAPGQPREYIKWTKSDSGSDKSEAKGSGKIVRQKYVIKDEQNFLLDYPSQVTIVFESASSSARQELA